MHTHGEAERVGGLLHVIAPVATLFLVTLIEVIDTHHAFLLTLRCEVIGCYPCLACILRRGTELSDVLTLLLYTLCPLLRIRDVLLTADVVPVLAVYLHLDAGSTCVLDHIPLADAYQTVDVIPCILIDACKVWFRIVVVPGCRKQAEDSELTVLAQLRCSFRLTCVYIGSLAHAVVEVTQRIYLIEQRYSL